VPDSPPAPDDLPKSPTGRIPRWVLDEAMGRPVESPGFRSYGAPDPHHVGSPRRRGRMRRWLTTLAVVGALAGLVLGARALGLNPLTGFGITAGREANAPAPGIEEASSPLGSPPPVDGRPSDNFSFAATQADGASPVTWSPCRPIHYVVRVLHQPPGGDRAVDRAFGAVSAATGLTFVDDGPTDEGPSDPRAPYQPDRYGDRWAPVLVAWATPDEVPDFGVDIAGEAGATRLTTPDGDIAYVSGVVFLDPAKYIQSAAQSSPAVADAVILHELGHLVGLAHVNDPNQVMWPRGNATGLTAFQPGDRAGLSALGRGACQPDV
jgi:hypothetical protein